MSFFARWCVIALIAACSLLVTDHATAGAGSAAADVLFREGVELAQKGNLEKAVEKFKASYAIEPAPGTLQGLALAEEKLGRLAAAWAHYRELLDRANQADDKKRIKLAKEKIVAVEARLAKLTLRVSGDSPSGAEIRLDGDVIPEGALGTAFPVDPGAHSVRGTASDGSSLNKTFELAEGQALEVSLSWERPNPDKPAAAAAAPSVAADSGTVTTKSGGGLRTVGIVVAAVGVVAAGAGTYFWLQSGSTYDDVKSECPDDRCPASTRDKVDDGKRQEMFGRIGFIVGGVAIATGATLFLIGGPKERSKAGVSPFVGPGSAGVYGRF